MDQRPSSPAGGSPAGQESPTGDLAGGPSKAAPRASRELPGHIAAALAGSGGATDSAGQPWAGRSLAGEDGKIHNFEDDDGTADAGYLAAVAALRSAAGDEAAVVASLAAARVFVPIVAQLAEEGEAAATPHSDSPHGETLHGDKQADMALVTLKAPDGRTAMPVFTSAAALASWHPEARPVAVYAPRAALSAVAEGAELLVLDPGSEYTFVVRRPAVWALAQQREWLPSYADPELALAMGEATAGYPPVRRVELEPGGGVASATAGGAVVPGGGPGPELRVVLYLEDGLDAAGVQSIVAGLNSDWSRNAVFAERVDSIEVKLQRAAE
ncbi:SseB family protein [Arthrobacter sp. Y81]|uniref:SseB family protein n=1 Tax=Arthrobacter sp. Y81 TaxID=2058897 RepID=UPI000CE39EF8|nr:SseB family protein [Arthrobacter sp. Y81]